MRHIIVILVISLLLAVGAASPARTILWGEADGPYRLGLANLPKSETLGQPLWMDVFVENNSKSDIRVAHIVGESSPDFEVKATKKECPTTAALDFTGSVKRSSSDLMVIPRGKKIRYSFRFDRGSQFSTLGTYKVVVSLPYVPINDLSEELHHWDDDLDDCEPTPHKMHSMPFTVQITSENLVVTYPVP